MKSVNRATLCVALLLMLLGIAVAAAESPLRDEANHHFGHARRVIQENCRNCDQLNEEALKQGLFEMRQAIDLKCEDPDAAYQLMAEGYKTLLSVFVTPGSPELGQLIPEQARIYDVLLEKHPADTDFLFERAKLSRDKEDKLAGFRRVLEFNANHVPARFAVAYLLLEAGKTREGLAEYRRLRPSAVKAEQYRTTVAALLRQQGLPKEAELARRETFAPLRYAYKPNH